jgi:uncharacterized damage-inducible protein DinB
MASELENFRAWFAYIADARRGYFATFEKLSPAELSRDRGASFPTLIDILAHSQGALWFWMSGCSKDAFPLPEKEPGEPPSLLELKEFETYLQERIGMYLAGLREEDLARTVFRAKGRGSGHDCHVPVREVFWHLVEEELQHRGELNALLWQIDVDPPVRSWIDWDHSVGRMTDPAPPGPGRSPPDSA